MSKFRVAYNGNIITLSGHNYKNMTLVKAGHGGPGLTLFRYSATCTHIPINCRTRERYSILISYSSKMF